MEYFICVLMDISPENMKLSKWII